MLMCCFVELVRDRLSNSKLFAMLSVGMLVENNTILASGERLDWSTKIKDILPEWKLMDEYASNHADVIDLMSTSITGS